MSSAFKKMPQLPNFIWSEVVENFDSRTKSRLLTLDRRTSQLIIRVAAKFFALNNIQLCPTFCKQTLPKLGPMILHSEDRVIPFTELINYCPNLISLVINGLSYWDKDNPLKLILQKLPKLASLDLVNCFLLDFKLMLLCRFKYLRVLRLPLGRFRSDEAIKFFEACRFVHLEELRIVITSLSLDIIELIVKKLPHLNKLTIYYNVSEMSAMLAIANTNFKSLTDFSLHSIDTTNEPLDLKLSKSNIPKLKRFDSNLQVNFEYEKENKSLLWPPLRSAVLTPDSCNENLSDFLSKLTHLVIDFESKTIDYKILSILSKVATPHLKFLEIRSYFNHSMMIYLTRPIIDLEQLNLEIDELPSIQLLVWVRRFAPNLKSLNLDVPDFAKSIPAAKNSRPISVSLSNLTQFSYISNCLDVSFIQKLLSSAPKLNLIITCQRRTNPLRQSLPLSLSDSIDHWELDNLDYLWSAHLKYIPWWRYPKRIEEISFRNFEEMDEINRTRGFDIIDDDDDNTS